MQTQRHERKEHKNTDSHVIPEVESVGLVAQTFTLTGIHNFYTHVPANSPALLLCRCPAVSTGSTMLLRLTERCRVPVRLDSVAGGAETGHKISAVYFIGRCTTEGAAADTTSTAQASGGGGHGLSEGSSANAGGQLKLQNIEAAAPLAEEVADSDGGGGGGSPSEARDRGGNKDAQDGAGTGSADGEAAAAVHPPAPSSSGTERSSPRQGQRAVLEPIADRLVLFRSDRVSTETLEVVGQGQEQYAVLFWMHGAKEGGGEETGGVTHSPSS